MSAGSLNAMQNAASAFMAAGKLPEAESIFTQITQAYPNYPTAFFLLAGIAHRTGRLPRALEYLEKTIAVDPRPAEPYFLRALILQQQSQLDSAVESYRDFLSRKPGDSRGLNNMGRALLDQGKISESITVLTRAIAITPPNPGAYTNLADAYRLQSDPDKAMKLYRQAIAIDPRCCEAHGNMGILLSQQGLLEESAGSIRRAIEINPASYNPRFNLARILQEAGKLDEAFEQCQAALQIRPNAADAHNLMGCLLGIMGEVGSCIAAQTRGVELKPDLAGVHSNLLLSHHYRQDLSPQQLFIAHQQWARQHQQTDATKTLNRNNRTGHQRLRIGYFSPNLQGHSVAIFFEPVLNAHDRAVVEVFCYSDVARGDATTQRLRSCSEHWREVAGKSDAEVIALIERDGIDILVDLAGHTAHNRLPMFSRKPAPVQFSWLGYPNTTGLSAMDYRITDAITDPPGESDALHTEQLIRVEGGAWAYSGPEDAVTSELPALSNGYVTFGSFNNLPKVSPQVLQTWAALLARLPGSRLLLKAAGLNTTIGRKYVTRHLVDAGLAPGRVEIVGWQPSTASHLNIYNRVDIALDTFPYNGTTTTCEALWMGVPVVSFAGHSHVSRVGAALLTHCNSTEWLATSPAGYIDLALDLASNLPALANVRSGLRNRLKHSALGDAVRLARALEENYRLAFAR